jgi:hypothetical protein
MWREWRGVPALPLWRARQSLCRGARACWLAIGGREEHGNTSVQMRAQGSSLRKLHCASCFDRAVVFLSFSLHEQSLHAGSVYLQQPDSSSSGSNRAALSLTEGDGHRSGIGNEGATTTQTPAFMRVLTVCPSLVNAGAQSCIREMWMLISFACAFCAPLSIALTAFQCPTHIRPPCAFASATPLLLSPLHCAAV